MSISPEDFAKAFLAVCIGLTILVPVVGITARIALKPIADLIGRMREGQSSNQTLSLIEQRLSLLEREVQSMNGLREDVTRIQEAQEFQLRLAAEREGMRSIEGSGI